MAGADLDKATGNEDEFLSQAWYKKFLIVLAGPVMNYISAFILFFMIIIFWGVQYQRPVVKYVEKNMPAYSAGMLSGDEITAVNGQIIKDARIISKVVKESADKKITLAIKRGAEFLDIDIVPVMDKKLKQSRIGIIYDIAAQPITVKVGFKEALSETLKNIWYWTVTPLKYLYSKVILMEAPSEMSGPIGIMQAAFVTAKYGFKIFLNFIAIVSVALGFFNLLPIPLVDGGHMFFFLMEGITKKRLNKKFMQFANSLGFAFLITIAVYATYRDIVRTTSGFWKQTEQVK